MKTKTDVQQRVNEFLNAKRWSMRKLALAAGLPPSTLARMMENNPTYKGEADAWQRLARYRDLGMTEAEVLAAVGLGPPPAGEANSDPWELFEAAMRLFNLPEEARVHLRGQIRFLREAALARQHGLTSDLQ